MPTCPACKAFLQPEWDRCKICGHDLTAPVEAAPAGRAGRRGRRARSGAAAAPAGAAARGGTGTLAPPAPARPATTGRAARPTPPPFADDQGRPPASSPDARPRCWGWLLAAGAAVVVGVGASVVLSGDDGDDRYADRPAGESADEAATEALGEWSTFRIGDAVRVALPAQPLVDETEDRILVVGDVSLVRGEVVSGGLTYTVVAGPLPEGVRNREPDELLGHAVDRIAEAEAGSVRSREEITVGGAPALRVTIAGLERDVHMVSLIDGGLFAELRVAGQEPDPLVLQRLIDTFDH